VFEKLPAAIMPSKVAISLREMSGTIGQLTGSGFSSILHVSESLLLICYRFAPPSGQPTAGYLPSVGSTERDGYSAAASFECSRWFSNTA